MQKLVSRSVAITIERETSRKDYHHFHKGKDLRVLPQFPTFEDFDTKSSNTSYRRMEIKNSEI
jgi:hypothetical protein